MERRYITKYIFANIFSELYRPIEDVFRRAITYAQPIQQFDNVSVTPTYIVVKGGASVKHTIDAINVFLEKNHVQQVNTVLTTDWDVTMYVAPISIYRDSNVQQYLKYVEPLLYQYNYQFVDDLYSTIVQLPSAEQDFEFSVVKHPYVPNSYNLVTINIEKYNINDGIVDITEPVLSFTPENWFSLPTKILYGSFFSLLMYTINNNHAEIDVPALLYTDICLELIVSYHGMVTHAHKLKTSASDYSFYKTENYKDKIKSILNVMSKCAPFYIGSIDRCREIRDSVNAKIVEMNGERGKNYDTYMESKRRYTELKNLV